MKDSEIKKLVDANPQMTKEEELSILKDENLTHEEKVERIFNANILFFVKQAHKFGNIEVDCVLSFAWESIDKSVRLYDYERGNRVLTLAGTILHRKLLRHYVPAKKLALDHSVSLDTPVGDNGSTFNDMTASEAPTPLERASSDDAKDFMWKGIDNLKPMNKEVMLMHLEGVTFREIGALLGITAAGAHLRYKKSVKILKERMNDNYENR